jgi:predicted DNA-binding antitoxin AbrB/MazE fold protein
VTLETIATVENGLLKPKAALPFREGAQVRLKIEAEWDAEKALKAWGRLKELLKQRPFVSGLHFTRDELHERD